jgi:hypothetical protein
MIAKGSSATAVISLTRSSLSRMLAAALLCLSACSSDDGSSDDGSSAGSAADAATSSAQPPVRMPDAASAECPPPDAAAPKDVFCIGLYRNRDPGSVSSDALPYTPGLTFWSDGAEKKRYLYLPPATTIDSSNMDAWKFPIGTKAFKEFRFNGKLVETRMVWRQAANNTVYATYIWNDAQTEAPLNESRQPVLLASGYEIPTTKDCGRCHHGGADKLLGVEAIELAVPTAQGITLASLVADGRLSAPPAKTSIVLPEDGTGKAAAALGYLHANCGMPCHSSRGLGDETNLLLRLSADQFWPSADDDAGVDTSADVTSTDTYRAAVDKLPTTASVAQKFPGAKRIAPAHMKTACCGCFHTAAASTKCPHW